MDDSADATDPPGSRQVGPRPLTVVKPARRPRRHCCWPGPDSSANNAITTPVVITRNATTSANWKPSATPSPLPRPPEPPPKSTPDQRRPVTPTRPHPTAGHHHFPVRSGRSGRKSSGFTLQFRRPEHPGVSSSSSIQRESGNRAELRNDTVLPPEGFAVERLSSDRVDVAPYGKELSRSPEGDQDRVGIQARVRSRVRDELAACGPYGQHQRLVRQPKRPIGQAPADQRRGGSDLDFLDSVIESLVVHDDVKELGHVRLQRKRRHPPPADQLRIDGPIGAGPQQFGLRLLRAGTGDDDEIGSQRSTGQGHENVVRIGVQRRDQRMGMPDAGGLQDAVVADIAQHRRIVQTLQAGGVSVDDDDLLPERVEIQHAGPAYAAPSADDEMTGHPAYPPLHPPPPQLLA